MTLRPALLLCLIAAACQQAPRSNADFATQTKCRQDVDRVYAAQNRVDLSRREDRDTPFAGNYISGNTARGLGAQFGRENQMASCVAQNRGGVPVDTGTGPTFSPASP